MPHTHGTNQEDTGERMTATQPGGWAWAGARTVAGVRGQAATHVSEATVERRGKLVHTAGPMRNEKGAPRRNGGKAGAGLVAQRSYALLRHMRQGGGNVADRAQAWEAAGWSPSAGPGRRAAQWSAQGCWVGSTCSAGGVATRRWKRWRQCGQCRATWTPPGRPTPSWR